MRNGGGRVQREWHAEFESEGVLVGKGKMDG